MTSRNAEAWRLPRPDQIGSDQLYAVLRATTASVLCAVANIALIGTSLWDAAPRGILVPWIFFALAVTAALLFRRGRQSSGGCRTLSRQTLRNMMIATALFASPWGALGAIFLGHLPPGNEMVLIAVTAGMAAGGGMLLAQVHPVALVFVAVVLIPFAGKCFWLADSGHVMLGLLAISYSGFLLAVIATTARLSVERSEALHKLTQTARDLGYRERLISAQNTWFDTALNNMTQGLCFFDAEERLIVCNRRYIDMHGFDPERVKPGVQLGEIVTMRNAGASPAISEGDYLAWRRAAGAAGHPSDTVFRLGDGRVFAVHYRPMQGGGWVATTDDITERHSLSEQLARNHQLLSERTNVLQAIVDNFPGGIGFYDRNLHIAVCNRRARDLLELPEHFFRDGPPRLEDVLRFYAERGEYGPGDVEAHVTEKLALVSERKSYHFQRIRPNGTVLDVRGAPVEGGGFIATYMDITERYRAEARIAHMATHDSLTELPNRVLFHERLETALGRAAEGNFDVAVLMLDLNGFKQVNDTLGHPAGDALLKCVAERLNRTVRSEDLVARLGGDEFAVVIQAVNAVTEAEAAAARIHAVLEAPFALGEQCAEISTSIGIALSGSTQESADELIKRADVALYCAKKCDAAYRIYEAGMRTNEPSPVRQRASAA